MADTAKLTILIQAKDEASKVLGQVSKESGGLSSQLKTLAVAAAGAVAAFASFKTLESSISATQELGLAVAKLSRETGLTTEASSELLFAFKHFGLSADDASRSIGIFAKKLKGVSDEETGVTTGGKSMAQILADIGVQATDANGNILPLDQILGPLADKFKAMPDGMEKTGLAMQLFGRSGKDMIPLLNAGSAGLEELSAEADKLGVTLSAENVGAIKQFTFAQRDMNEAIAGVKIQIGMALMPVLTRFAEWFVSVQPQIREFVREGIEKVKAAIEALKPVIEKAGEALDFVSEHKEMIIGALAAIGVVVAATVVPAFLAWAAATIAATWPIIALIAAGAALGLAIKALIDHWDEIKAKTLEVWGTISDFLNEKFGFLRGLFETAFGAIKRYVEFVWTDIKAIFQAALDTIKNAFGFWKDVFSGDWEGAWGHIKEQFGIIWDLIEGLFENRLGLIRDIAVYALGVLQNVFSEGFGKAKDLVLGIMDTLRDLLAEHWQTIVQVALAVLFPPGAGLWWIVTHFGEVKDAVLGFIGNIVDAITGLPGTVAGLVGSWFGAARDLGDAMFRGLMEGLRQAPGMVEAFLSGIWEAIRGLINQAIDAVNNAIPNSIGAFGIGIDLPDNPIPHLAAGIRDFAGGLAWIGERGPELLALPRGSSVYSARESRQMAAGATYHFHGDIILPGVREPADFAQGLYRALRLRGHIP